VLSQLYTTGNTRHPTQHSTSTGYQMSLSQVTAGYGRI